MAQVRIEDSSGTERATVPLVELVKEEALHKNTLARITISRADLNDISNLTPGEDRVFIEDPANTDTFGGVLRSPGRSGGMPRLVVDGFEEYMSRAEPVAKGQVKTAVSDDTLINECISATSQLSGGGVNSVGGSNTFVFSGVTQLAKARKVAQVSGGELSFEPDLTVDYVNQLGVDQSGVDLSPAKQSFVEDTFQVDRDGIAGKATHLKVYGVGEGAGQILANIVPAADSSSYENEATYTHPTWSDGDDKIWASRTNKDLKNAGQATTWGQNLIKDLQNEEVRVRCTVKGATVNLGDRYHIKHPEEGVDEVLRAVEVTKVIGAKGGTRYECVWSNFDYAHEDPTADNHRDVGRYNKAFEGDLTNIQVGPGRGPVDSTHDYEISVHYPDDVVHEVDAQLKIKGLNYRAFSQGAAAGGTDKSSSAVSNSTGVVLGDGESIDLDITIPNNYSDNGELSLLTHINTNGTEADAVHVDVTSNGTILAETLHGSPSGVITSSHGLLPETVIGTTDLNAGDTINVQWINVAGRALTVQNRATEIFAETTHSHSVDPGLIDFDGVDESPALYPQDVDITVNSQSSEGTSYGNGSAEFEVTHSLTGNLTTGWNTIKLNSSKKGHLDAVYSADLFRQSTGGNAVSGSGASASRGFGN